MTIWFWQRWQWIHCLALIVWESLWNEDRREIDNNDADLDDDDLHQHHLAYYYDDKASAAGDNDGNYNADEDEYIKRETYNR